MLSLRSRVTRAFEKNLDSLIRFNRSLLTCSNETLTCFFPKAFSKRFFVKDATVKVKFEGDAGKKNYDEEV